MGLPQFSTPLGDAVQRIEQSVSQVITAVGVVSDTVEEIRATDIGQLEQDVAGVAESVSSAQTSINSNVDAEATSIRSHVTTKVDAAASSINSNVDAEANSIRSHVTSQHTATKTHITNAKNELVGDIADVSDAVNALAWWDKYEYQYVPFTLISIASNKVLLNVTGAGYLHQVGLMGNLTCQLRVTVDGVIKWLGRHEGNSVSGLYNPSAVLNGLVDGVISHPNAQYLQTYPKSTLIGSTYEWALLHSPIFFRESLKVEILYTGSSASINYNLVYGVM